LVLATWSATSSNTGRQGNIPPNRLALFDSAVFGFHYAPTWFKKRERPFA
jgi:hypothetical protein